MPESENVFVEARAGPFGIPQQLEGGKHLMVTVTKSRDENYQWVGHTLARELHPRYICYVHVIPGWRGDRVTGHELAMALRVAYLALHRRTTAALAADGVTADQFVVLATLAQAEPLTQRELVERTHSDHNTLRAILVLLEHRGLIERRPHPTDGRARSVSLTAEGTRVFRKLWKHSEGLRLEMLDRLSAREVTALVRMLHRFAKAMSRPGTKTTAGAQARPDLPAMGTKSHPPQRRAVR